MYTTAMIADYRPLFDHRCIAVSSGSTEILQRLGLWTRLRKHATAIRRVHVSDRGNWGGACIDADELRLDSLGYVVETAGLAPSLLEWPLKARGVTSLMPIAVRRLQPGQRPVRLPLASERGEH